MAAWLIVSIGLWTYPIISFIVVYLTRNRPRMRKHLFWYLILANLIAASGFFTNISTTLKELDWIIVTSFYFTICHLLWLGFWQRNIIIRAVSSLAIICVFSGGYFFSTIGALGFGFTILEFEPKTEMWLGNGIIYKETMLGNASSDYRAKRVEIYKTISWFPLIEWRIKNKVYEKYVPFRTSPLTVKYRPNEQKIYLSASMWWEYEHKRLEWADTLSIGN